MKQQTTRSAQTSNVIPEAPRWQTAPYNHRYEDGPNSLEQLPAISSIERIISMYNLFNGNSSTSDWLLPLRKFKSSRQSSHYSILLGMYVQTWISHCSSILGMFILVQTWLTSLISHCSSLLGMYNSLILVQTWLTYNSLTAAFQCSRESSNHSNNYYDSNSL